MIKQVENEQVDLEALQCNPEDVIILRYNLEKTSVDRALQIHSVMKDLFPDNKVISLPDSWSCQMCSKEELREIANELANYLL